MVRKKAARKVQGNAVVAKDTVGFIEDPEAPKDALNEQIKAMATPIEEQVQFDQEAINEINEAFEHADERVEDKPQESLKVDYEMLIQLRLVLGERPRIVFPLMNLSDVEQRRFQVEWTEWNLKVDRLLK